MILRLNDDWRIGGLFPFGKDAYIPSVRQATPNGGHNAPLSGRPMRKAEAINVIAQWARSLQPAGFVPVTDPAIVEAAWGDADPYAGMEAPPIMGALGKYLADVTAARTQAKVAEAEAAKAKADAAKAEAEARAKESSVRSAEWETRRATQRAEVAQANARQRAAQVPTFIPGVGFVAPTTPAPQETGIKTDREAEAESFIRQYIADHPGASEGDAHAAWQAMRQASSLDLG